MFSPVLFRFSKPNSCLILLIFLPYFHHLPCALSQRDLRLCDTLFHCGNFTAGFPFWGNTRPEPCGHPSLVLHCDQTRNKTYMIISGQMYSVLQIDKESNTLRLARQDFLGESFCSATFTGTTLTPELFDLTSDYKTLLVYYLCDDLLYKPSWFTCPKIGVASVHRTVENLENCGASFNITLPVSYVPEEEALNLTRLGSVLRNGFKVKLKFDARPCKECQSSGGICGYDVATPVCCKTNSSSGSVIGCSPIIPYGSSVDERHKHCTPWFRCGNQTDLYYPFWTPERKECGHPDFEVNCSGDFPEFSMLSVKFRILEMNNGSPIIRLARLDSLNNLCPQHPENATINQQVFSLLPDTELQTFYYNCPGSSIDFLPKGYISQLDCEEGLQIYFVSSPSDSSNRAILDELSTSCESEVYTPVSRSALKIAETDHSLEVMKKALDEGFTLELNGDCSECMRSRGACGYNWSSRAFACYCANEPHAHTCQPEKKKLSKSVKIGFGFTCGFLGATLLAGGLFCFIIRRRKNMATQYTIQNLEDVSPKKKEKQNLKGLIPLKQYTYTEVKRITKSLAEVVGKGGFGTVYRGKLRDGRVVAVKILKESKGDGEDFINEVASMSKTSHVNIVSLLGFCYDGSKRAIIYEYIENGSLDQYFSSKIRLNKDWRTLYEIALGIARGLEYLHNGCQTRIVHFDIKPQNVLLDGNLCPKVSDFGLAKLCGKRESILSLLDTRGTIGYIAPEVFSRTYGNVSYKADVYSYGMLVIEMIGARNRETAQNSESNTSSMYFPEWIYKDLENENYQKLLEEDITVEHEGIVKKMILVGLWCIQSSPSNRPPMNRVIEMLEGSVEDLEVPSKPVLHLAATQFIESSCLLEENSGYSEV